MAANQPLLRLAVRAAAALVAAIGVLALAGWAANLPSLTRGAQSWASTKPNTAACLIALAAALWLLCRRRPPRVLAAGFGGLVALAASLTLLEYAANVEIGIDELLFSVDGQGHEPARMAVMTAVALLLLGAGVIASVTGRVTVLYVAGLAAFAIGYVALLGYGFEARALYSFSGYKSVALPTAVSVVLAAAALLATQPERGLVGIMSRPGFAGQLTRRVIPFLLVGAAGLGMLAAVGTRAGIYQPGFATALLAVAVAAVGIGVVWRAAVVIGRADRAREASAGALAALTEELQAQLATIVGTGTDAIVMVSADGTILDANAHAGVMFGRSIAELVGSPVDALLPSQLRERHAAHREGYGQAPRLRPMGQALALVGCRADGSEFPVAVSLAPMPGSGAPVLLATIRDLTDIRSAEAAAAESAHLFAAAFDDGPVGMLLVDLQGRIRQINRALATMLGAGTAGSLVGLDLMVLIDPRDIDDDLAQRADLLAGRIHSYQRELRLLDSDGAPVWVLVSTACVRDAAGQPANLVLHVEDVRSRRQYEGRLQYLADHDPLTGLYNRRRFDQELSQHLAAHTRYGGAGAVLLLDLDNFKYVNDTLGHNSGDALIRSVATALRQRIRQTDILARLGGDEFAVLAPAADGAQALSLAQALLDTVRSVGAEGAAGTRTRTSASIGIALFDDVSDANSAESLVAAADMAMYAAKEQGRNRAVAYDANDPRLARAQDRFHWLDRIHTALERDLFTLWAQPIVDFATGRVTQLELLLRMRDGEQLIAPGRFLYIAERHGLGPALDQWVIRRAIGFAATMTAGDPPLVEVNLSADSLADQSLPGFIAGLLAEHQVPASRMVFEVTETAAIENIDTARSFVEQLAELGCRFALDDFGAGFGSFYYLKYLPFDFLKIDGEFVRNIATSRTDQLIVSSIVDVARGLGKKTIAEYVGDAATVDLLGKIGVDYGQGYYLGRPADPLASNIPAQSTAPPDTASRTT